MRRVIVVMATLVALGALPGPTYASAPGATTQAASGVTAATATLNGTVNPNKESTTFVFQYGTTTAYGSQTPAQPAVNGNGGKTVKATISGLAAKTTYHFRLVATNPSGTATGNDAVLTTAAPTYTVPPGPGQGTPNAKGNAVSMAVSPSLLTFGRSTVITGQVTGPSNSGIRVQLAQNTFPFTTFKVVGASTTTDKAGKYRFTIAPRLLTRYQVTAMTSPPVSSGVVQVRVRFRVGLSVNDSTARRGQRIRFFGSVAPAHNGRTVRIQRRTSTGSYRTIATTALRASTSSSRSVYSRRLRVFRTGIYRVRVVADADHASGTSRTRAVRVS